MSHHHHHDRHHQQPQSHHRPHQNSVSFFNGIVKSVTVQPEDPELSVTRFSLPTLSSARRPQQAAAQQQQRHGAAGSGSTTPRPSEVTSGDVGIPQIVEQIQNLTPRERVKLEFSLQHRFTSRQKPTHLFGSTFDKEAERRRAVESLQGFKNEQTMKKTERHEARQSLRLSRSDLALSMSQAVELGREERAVDAAAKRPSPWVKNEAGADRHKYQVNWPDRSGAPMPTVPQKWSAPGPGSYGNSTLFSRYDPKLLKEALEDAKKEHELAAASRGGKSHTATITTKTRTK